MTKIYAWFDKHGIAVDEESCPNLEERIVEIKKAERNASLGR
jgi:hypothetical protein